MSFIYFHSQNLAAFYLVFYGLLVVGWFAIVYALIKFWGNQKEITPPETTLIYF